MSQPTREVNFDGLVGPTHNYAGLAYGNLASQKFKGTISNPRAAALEGLRKMKLLADLGIPQAVLPPQHRPDLATLRRLGFAGSDGQVLDKAYRTDPVLFAACCSASSMWAANAATVSPSADTADGRIHITPANLVSQFHRSLEPSATAVILKAILPDERHFAHHAPLPPASQLSDEGAANHLRLCSPFGGKGLEIFVYGRSAFGGESPEPRTPNPAPRFFGRQARETSAVIARLHQLDEAAVLFLKQNPLAVDQGAFHNDVVAMSNQQVLLYHTQAFEGGQIAIDTIRQRFASVCNHELIAIPVDEVELPLTDAISTYLFNSQLVTLPDGSMCLIAPMECADHPAAHRTIDRILSSHGPIRSVRYAQVRQSMQNGGGPACLRLRMELTEEELQFLRRSVLLTNDLYANLVSWVERHYRTSLTLADLADAALLDESRTAMDELGRILHLDSAEWIEVLQGKAEGGS